MLSVSTYDSRLHPVVLNLQSKVKAAAKAVEKDSNDLDAVAGNAEDDIGELIAGIREKELLFGEKCLLAMYGPLIAHICASPKRYRVSGNPRLKHTY